MTEASLQHTPVPLLLVHGKVELTHDQSVLPLQYHMVLVPLNGSLFAEQAVPAAQRIAAAANATLCLIGVAPEPESVTQAEAGLIPWWMVVEREIQRERLNQYLAVYHRVPTPSIPGPVHTRSV